MEERRVALILGYGIPADILNDGNYRRYLRVALNHILASKIEWIILCGGHTNLRLPQATEADEMVRFILRMLPTEVKFDFSLERESLTSWENLIGAERFLSLRDGESLDIVVFCEYSRSRKIRMLARKILLAGHPERKFKVIGVDFDASRTFTKDVKQLAAVVFTALECWFPSLNEWARKRQLVRIGKLAKEPERGHE